MRRDRKGDGRLYTMRRCRITPTACLLAVRLHGTGIGGQKEAPCLFERMRLPASQHAYDSTVMYLLS